MDNHVSVQTLEPETAAYVKRLKDLFDFKVFGLYN